MNTYRIIRIKRLQNTMIPVLFFCSLLLFSCIKDKESERSYPRVTTGLVTNINTVGVTFNGSFLQSGNSEVIDHGFVFGPFASPNIQLSEIISLGVSKGNGSFTATANFGLESGKLYYVSAYARNKDKIFYGEYIRFISAGSAFPEISAIEPEEGLRGDTVVIRGMYFSQLPGNNIVKFGDRDVSVITASNTELSVLVPASTGKEYVDVFVTTAGQTAQKISGFRYLKPEITGLSSGKGVIGDTITMFSYFKKQP